MIISLGALLFICSFAIVIAGLLSFLRNPERSQNKWFLALSLSVGFWTVSNFIASNISHQFITELAVKLDFSSAIFMAWCLLKFVSVFIVATGEGRKTVLLTRIVTSRTFSILTCVLNIIVILAIFLNQIFTVQIKPELVIKALPTYPVYIALVILYVVLALGDLFIGYWKGTNIERQKLSYIVGGFSAAAVGNILSNIVFPSLISDRSTITLLNGIGYLSVFILVLFLYLAITTRRLFDIRLVIARSLAYVFIIGTLGIFYLTVLSTASLLFLTENEINIRGIIINFAATGIAVITFPYLRKFFTRLTSQLFFKDDYEIQDVVNNLTAITTTTLDLDKLFSDSGRLINSSLKSSWSAFALQDEKNNFRIIGDSIRPPELKNIGKEVKPYLKPGVILDADTLDKARLLSILQKYRIEVIVPMHANQSLIGFITLGTKQNGAAYGQKDHRLLKIGADSLSVAAQNALRFEEIQNFASTLQGKVDEATKNLRKANEKLKQMDQTKDDFISMASHQLRTPLTSVKGYVSMVMEGDAGKINSGQRKLLDQAFISSQRMVYLIADLLNVSRLRTGKFIIEPKPTNLADVVEGEITQLIETAKGRELELTYQKPKDFPTLMLDDTKIRQVIMNFADNAIYYTPAGGHIKVGLEDKGESVEFTVVDDGIGVPKAEQHHLFGKFYRAGNAKKARPDGTGLGLFMAKKVIVAQGGSIIFHSAEGKGSTFGFSFAKAPLLPEHFKGPKPPVETTATPE